MASITIDDTGWKPQATKMKCDAPLKENMADPLCHALKSNFLFAVLGRAGSGKSSYIHSLFHPHKIHGKHGDLCGAFHTIIYCSPSAHTVLNNVFDELDDLHRFDDMETCLDAYQDVIEMDIAENKKAMRDKWEREAERAFELGKKAPKKPKDYKHRSLIYFDDVGFQQRGNGGDYEKKFNRLIHNRRHMFGGISIISANQDYTQLSPQIRKSCNAMAVFQPGIDEYEAVLSKMGVPRKLHNQFMEDVYDEQYNFTFCDFTRGIPRLYKNQDSLITLKRG